MPCYFRKFRLLTKVRKACYHNTEQRRSYSSGGEPLVSGRLLLYLREICGI